MTANILLLVCLFSTTFAFSPPLSRNFLLNLQRRFPRPASLLEAGYTEPVLRGPPTIRTMNGPPGSYFDNLNQKNTFNRWYVAPPARYQGQQADWVNVERRPVGPPGSDAANMGKELSYGPPGSRDDLLIPGPPSSTKTRGRFRSIGRPGQTAPQRSRTSRRRYKTMWKSYS